MLTARIQVVGSKWRTPPAAFYEKAGYRFPEKVAVASEGNPADFYEKVGCDFPKKW